MADQKAPVRHHYVPRMLLKRFMDTDDRLWTFNKASPEKGVLPKSIGSVFFEKHRYSVIKADGTKDVSLEHALSEIEGDADRFIEKVVATVRAGNTPHITKSDHALWMKFLRVQWLRRPGVVTDHMSPEEFDEFLDEEIAALTPFLHRIPPQALALVKTPEWRKRLKRNLAAQMVTQPMSDVQNTLSQMGLAIAVLRKSNKSFVIGSHPVIRCAPPGGGKLGTPGVELWLPVARDVAISPLPEPGIVRVLDGIADADLRRLNLAIYAQSREIASSSQSLVASIVGACGG